MIILLKKIIYLRIKEVNRKEKVDSFVITLIPSALLSYFWC